MANDVNKNVHSTKPLAKIIMNTQLSSIRDNTRHFNQSNPTPIDKNNPKWQYTNDIVSGAVRNDEHKTYLQYESDKSSQVILQQIWVLDEEYETISQQAKLSNQCQDSSTNRKIEQIRNNNNNTSDATSCH